MTPEFVDLLKDWGAGIFWVTLALIWAIENIVTSRRGHCYRTTEQLIQAVDAYLENDSTANWDRLYAARDAALPTERTH